MQVARCQLLGQPEQQATHNRAGHAGHPAQNRCSQPLDEKDEADIGIKLASGRHQHAGRARDGSADGECVHVDAIDSEPAQHAPPSGCWP